MRSRVPPLPPLHLLLLLILVPGGESGRAGDRGEGRAIVSVMQPLPRLGLLADSATLAGNSLVIVH